MRNFGWLKSYNSILLMKKTNIYNILRGTFLVNDDAFKNWRFIIFLSLLAIVMIASSHSVDRKVHQIAKISNEAKELRSIFIEGRGRLMELKKESEIERKMLERGLRISNVPPVKIKVISEKK